MKHNINLSIIQTKNSKEITHNIQGRLLGLATNTEAMKIFNNWKLASKVYTNKTKEVKTVIKLLEFINDDDATTNLGHIIMTVGGIKEEKDTTFIPSLSKQLFISPPVNLVTEEIRDSTTETLSVIMKCTNGALLTMEENTI